METRQAALANVNSTYYANICSIIRRSMADKRAAEDSRRRVMVPFRIDSGLQMDLERKFGWKLYIENHGLRSVHAPSVAALTYCMGLRNLLAMGFDGEEVISVDADLPLVVAKGASYVKVVRTGMSNRLAAGYGMEQTQLERLRNSSNNHVRLSAMAMLRDLAEGGGSRVFLNPNHPGIRGDTVLFDHTRTSISLAQAVACATTWHASTIRGVCFFQPEMLVEDEGELQAFAGHYIIDRELDVITYIPEVAPETCFSHCWTALRSFFVNHECRRDGKTWLVEKHLSGDGIFHYVASRAQEPWEYPVELGANYYSGDLADWTELEYPSRGGVLEGAAPGYWRREKVKLLTSLYDKTISTMLAVDPKRLTISDTVAVMRAYNNTTVIGGDTVKRPIRTCSVDLMRAATVILSQVVVRRAKASASCGHILDVIRKRYNLANESLLCLALEAGSSAASWLYDVSVGVAFDSQSPELAELFDGAIDMRVLAKQVPQSIEVRQLVGVKFERDCGPMIEGLPGVRSSFLTGLLKRARASAAAAMSSTSSSGGQSVGESSASHEHGGVGLGSVSESSEVRSSDADSDVQVPPLADSGISVTTPKNTGFPVVVHEDVKFYDPVEREGVAGRLFDRLVAEQDAADYVKPPRLVDTFESVSELPVDVVPTVHYDTAGMQDDYDDGFPEVSTYDAEVVPYVATTADTDLTISVPMAINDAKREVAAPRWVRRSKARAGAAGMLPRTQLGLLSAVKKRNADVPTNRGDVDLPFETAAAVAAVQDVCYVDDWRERLNLAIKAGLWRPTTADLSVYVGKVETAKAERMIHEYMMCKTDADFRRWLVMVKSKTKPPMDAGAHHKVPQPQTIMYNENPFMNAEYSSIMSAFHETLESLIRPNVRFNDRASPADHEVWFNSLQPVRSTAPSVYQYQGDSYNFDRGQELMALGAELRFYRDHGLDQATLDLWSQTMGPKAAVSIMHGVLMHIVMQGLSGIFKTLMRNGLVTWMAVVTCLRLDKSSLISLDIKGDDYTVEVSRPLDVAQAVRDMAWRFNFSAKLWGCDHLYFCSKYWLFVDGWWYWVTDPIRKFESLAAAVAVDEKGETKLAEKWVSLRDDLRHYNNGLVMDELARAVLIADPRRSRPPIMLIGGLARLAENKEEFFAFYGPAEVVGV